MLLEAELRGRDDAIDDRQQPCVATAMPAPLDGDGFEAEIDGSQMRRRCQSCLPQRFGGQQPAGPWRVLQDLQHVPGVEGDRRPQYPPGLAALVLSVASR